MPGETGPVRFLHAELTLLMEMPFQEEIHTFQVQIQIRELAGELQEVRQLHPIKEEPPHQLRVPSRQLLKQPEDRARTKANISVPDLKVKEMQQI